MRVARMMCRCGLAVTIALAHVAGAAAIAPTPRPQNRVAMSKQRSERDQSIIAGVRRVLDVQVAAWNRGDIEGFMDGYARSDDTVFVSGDEVRRGWQTVLERYKKTYDSRAKMGTLVFSELEVTPVNRDTAVALGRWQLTRAGDMPRGRFTLLFRRTPQGWRIVHDHTSSASP